MTRKLMTLAAAAAALSASTGVAGASGPAITGSGASTLSGDPFAGDLVTIELGGGRFNVVHHDADGGTFAHLQGYLDCTTGGAGSGVATGVITGGFDDLGIDPIGERMSFAVTDGNPDVVAIDVSFLSGHPIPACSSDPILVLPVERGNFTVR